MSYSYLFDLYQEIDNRVKQVEDSVSGTPPDRDKLSYYKGKLDILLELKSHLEKSLNPKLPRAIARKLRQKGQGD